MSDSREERMQMRHEARLAARPVPEANDPNVDDDEWEEDGMSPEVETSGHGDPRYDTTCNRCGEAAMLPTVATLVAYVRQHDVTCPRTDTLGGQR